MTDPLPKSRQPTSKAIRKRTSSQGSGDGPMPLALPDGRQSDLFGPAPVHASHSAQQAKEPRKRMPVTYGRRGFGSSESADLSASLASKLQERLDGVGSPEYQQTWRRKVTPLGKPYLAQQVSARRTSGSGCGSWPTPSVNNYEQEDLEALSARRARCKEKHGNGNGAGTPPQLRRLGGKSACGDPAPVE